MKGSHKLTERIKQLRAELDTLIDEEAAERAKTAPGIPVPVIRQLITNRAPGCQCRQTLELLSNG